MNKDEKPRARSEDAITDPALSPYSQIISAKLQQGAGSEFEVPFVEPHKLARDPKTEDIPLVEISPQMMRKEVGVGAKIVWPPGHTVRVGGAKSAPLALILDLGRIAAEGSRDPTKGREGQGSEVVEPISPL